jgi:hypothetical protein
VDEVQDATNAERCRDDPGTIGVAQDQSPSESAGHLHGRTLCRVPHTAEMMEQFATVGEAFDIGDPR